MTRTRLCALVLACMVVDAAQVEAQRQATQSQFRVWQFLPDSSRANPGGMAFNGENGDNDFHMFIALGSTPSDPDVRLDGDFVVHQLRDSTLVVGDITAIRVLSRDSTRRFARDFAGEDRVERRTYRLRLGTNRGAPVWFYPFGVPRRGERGIAFEVTSDTGPADASHQRAAPPYRLPPGAVPMAYGIDGLTRPHRARVRVEVGDTAFRPVFEGQVLTRVPVRIAMKDGARGQDLMFELEAQRTAAERQSTLGEGEMCWRWFWADERPPGGFGCAARFPGDAVERSLDGAPGRRIRVTLWPER